MKKISMALALSLAILSANAQVKGKQVVNKSSPNAAFSINEKAVKVYTTANNTGHRIEATATLSFSEFGQPLESQACIFVDPAKRFQTMLGIGGAITDASAEVFAQLPAENQSELLTAYYHPVKGIGYTLARTNIQSCDFSSDMYDYADEKDSSLKSFNIQHDLKFRIPLIRQAIKMAGGKLTLYGSPWSPPAWMKDNNDKLNGGKLKPQYYTSWANMFVKFIQAYEKEGVPVWGFTVQNEPMAKQVWESCMYTAEEERDFVKKYLGPVVNKAGLGDKKLIIWDHNRDLLFQRATTVLSDPEAAKYVWGTGFHWYVRDAFENVKRVQEAFPNKNLLFTEGCAERFNATEINGWKWGELYGKSMVNDFNNGAVGWTDWNILLDEVGGPNHVGNFCYAPVHADTKTGKLTYMNSFYYIGHFSKFIRPGAKRVSASSNRDQLLTTAFLNPDGKLAVVVLNLTEESIPYKLWIDGKAAETTSLPHSIVTFVL